jgi:hypothetical protein
LLIHQLFHVQQSSSIANYMTQFKELVDQLAPYSSDTTPLYFTTCFIDDPCSNIKYTILFEQHKDLDTAFYFGSIVGKI